MERAVRLLEMVVAQSEQVHGDTHLATLASQNNLARIREAAEAVQQPDTGNSESPPALHHHSDTPERT
ncbi:hypothetical protein ACH4VT_22285 [Streptomyces lydicus]|uniref:hypothetical protein n=1 Tax=Streptomyces lydicus TaxID=47763 RepID=UPI0037959A67